jgi:hypothetical protein
VFTQARASDVPTWYSHSADKGATWSDPVPLLENVTSGSPWVAGGQGGQAAAIFFGCSMPCGYVEEADWWMFAARITENGTVIATQRTTQEPLFHGKQGLGFAEFNMVRLDAEGNIRIGASIPFQTKDDGSDLHWQAMYQRQDAGLTT